MITSHFEAEVIEVNGQSYKDEILRLCDAAAEIRNAINDLWQAQNPGDVVSDRPILSVDQAQKRQSEAFYKLESAEYHVRKRMAGA